MAGFSAARVCLLLLSLTVCHGQQALLKSCGHSEAEQCHTSIQDQTALLQLPATVEATFSVSEAAGHAASNSVKTPLAADGGAGKKPALSTSTAVRGGGVGGMLAAFFATAALTATLIIFLYWSKGLRVICMVLSYLAALASIRLCVNAVVTQNFAFPLFLTMSHFVGSAAVAFICAHIWQAERNWPTGQQWVTFFLPVAAAHATSVSVSNIAIVHATTSFVEVVSATSPLVTFGTVFLFGQPLRTVQLYPLIVIVMGTIIASEGQVAFSLLGFVLVFSGNILRSVKATMQQILLVKGPDGKAAFTPLEVTVCTSLLCAVVMGVWSLLTEGLAPVRALAQANASLAGTFVLSIVVACFLNISVLFTIKELGAVGTQLVGQAKTLLVVVGSVALFGDKVTVMGALGMFMVMAGVWFYNHLEASWKAEQEAKLKENQVRKDPQATDKVMNGQGQTGAA